MALTDPAVVRILGIIRTSADHVDEVEGLLRQAVEYSRAEGHGTLAHDIYRGPDGVSFAFHEAWEDSEAAVAHQSNIPPDLLDRLGRIATLDRIEVFGDASAEYRQKLGNGGSAWYPLVAHL
jgi:hypothetical protein